MWQEILQGGGGGSTKVQKGTFKGLGMGVYTSIQNCGFKPKYVVVFCVGNNDASYKQYNATSIYNDGEIINSFTETQHGNLIFYRESSYANFEITNDGFKFVQNFSGGFVDIDMEFLAIG